jgi:glycosyltransferase involved in cell wall biosynthesis
MTTINLNNEFSTTRLMTMEMPVIVNTPSSKVQSHLFLPPNPERRGEGGLRTKGYFKQSYRETSEVSEKFTVPLVTIITVVFNGEKHLEQTIQSVISQTYNNVEYIVIDGGSTDGTVDIIRKYEEVIDYWVSEPDGGIYDAMNKGIILSTGEIVGLINSGDVYSGGTLQSIVKVHLSHTSSILTGNCKAILSNPSKWIIASGRFETLPYRMIPHSSVFVPLSIYKDQGLFDTSFKIAGDYDFLVRCYSKVIPFVTIDEILSTDSPRGVSGNYYLTNLEFTKVRLCYRLLPKSYCLLLYLRSFCTITIHKILEYLGLWYLIEAKRHGSIR